MTGTLKKKDGSDIEALRQDAGSDKTILKKQDVVSLAWELAEPICVAEGMALIHVEYQREPAGRVLRIYVDRPGGVTLDDCTNVSRQLGDLLDIKLEGDAAYTLEVSSPGRKRPISRIDDFERYKGGTVKIRTALPICGRKNFTGVLSGMVDGNVTLTTETQTVVIPFQEIMKARLVNYNGDNKC